MTHSPRDEKTKTPKELFDERKDMSWQDGLKLDAERSLNFLQKHAIKFSPVIGKLYWGSRALMTVSAGLAMSGVPGAATTTVISMAASKALKVTWDHLRDLKDATEGQDTNDELIAEIDNANHDISMLWDTLETQEAYHKEEVSEWSDLVATQNQAISELTRANEQLASALSVTQQEHARLEAEFGSLSDVVGSLRAQIESQQQPNDIRASNRKRFEAEIQEAEQSGLLEREPFDPDHDPFVRVTEDADSETYDEQPRLTAPSF